MHRRTLLIQAALWGLGLQESRRSALAQPAQSDAGPAADLINAQTQKALDHGLSYLSARQNSDGSYGDGGYSRNVAICSLCAMAFMSAGSTPARGKHGREVANTVRFILSKAQDSSGFIHAPEGASRGPMYEHGFAALLLAEAYGMWPDSEVRQKLSKAVRLIINTQNSQGGWRYDPKPESADISVTVCQVMALRAARNAGIEVPSETIDRCTEYVKRCQNADGGFMYMLENGGPSQFPRSAAGVVALYSAGIYEGKEVRKGLDYLMQHLPSKSDVATQNYFFYGHYYAAQAMWLAGGKYWEQWYPAIRDLLLARQNKKDGSWFDTVSPEYGAAMACLILQMPCSHLPIFQR